MQASRSTPGAATSLAPSSGNSRGRAGHLTPPAQPPRSPLCASATGAGSAKRIRPRRWVSLEGSNSEMASSPRPSPGAPTAAREPKPGTPRTGLRRGAACRDDEARSGGARRSRPRSSPRSTRRSRAVASTASSTDARLGGRGDAAPDSAKWPRNRLRKSPAARSPAPGSGSRPGRRRRRSPSATGSASRRRTCRRSRSRSQARSSRR